MAKHERGVKFWGERDQLTFETSARNTSIS